MADTLYAVTSGFYDAVDYDRLYTADQMNMPYKRIITEGVFATPQGTESTDFQVKATSGLKLSVLAGNALLGGKWIENGAAVQVTVPANTTLMPRIDSVILRVDRNTAVRSASIIYRTGTPASTPTAPALVHTSNIAELRLANVSVAAGATSISQSAITDMRGTSGCPWVTSLIKQVDTSVLFEQYQQAQTEQLQMFDDEWHDYIDGLEGYEKSGITITTGSYTTSGSTSEIKMTAFGINNYDPSGDLVMLYINGLYAIEGDKWTLTTTDTPSNPKAVFKTALDAGQSVYIVVLKPVAPALADEVADLKEDLSTKAEIDGYYEEMTVGNAEQLISSVYVEDSEAYKYRTSGGSADIGNREYVDEIVGGSIAWNQLVQNGNFADTSIWAKTAATSLSIANNEAVVQFSNNTIGSLYQSDVPFVSGHKYILGASVKGDGAYNAVHATIGASVFVIDYDLTTSYKRFETVFTCNTTSTSLNIVRNNSAVGEKIYVKDVRLIDLTAMFGSTIADYIYSLETATAGAGVAFFKKLFPNDYYEYNPGELISVEGLSSHDMVGFNQYNDNGTARVIGGNQYQITGTYTALSLDGETITPDSNGLFIPSATGTLTVTGGGDDTCVHLTWSGSRNGDYEEYVKHSYALDDSLTLRGIPKLSDGKLTFDGDVYASDGTVTRKYGIVTYDGTESGWSWYDAYQQATIALPSTAKYASSVVSYMCNSLTPVSNNNRMDNIGNYATLTTQGGTVSFSSPYTSLGDFKTWLGNNPITFVYELATPTTETAEPYQSPQIVDDYGTEEYISTTIVPVGHNTKYMANSVDKLNHLPTLADSDGDYVIRQSGTQMSLIPLTQVKELPDAPSADGTYTLKVTVANGTVAYTWEVE